MEGTIQAMALVTEMRDPYTAGHQRRVATLSSAIAMEMGLSGEEIDGIYLAGVVHDIGKIYVPAEILSKPGRLTEIEFHLIKVHPQVGFDILKTIEFPWPIAQIVLQHHEKMNGSGYPSGISGGDILLGARILSVADVVEAISSHRPYRPALGVEKALREISSNRGTLFDAHVVDACIRLFIEKGFQFE
jgi:putative nucleotidyltransferase with HDIG domain